jgi:predicted nucleic acid-binding protein
VYLVDTSVWIDYLQGKKNPAVSFLHEQLRNPIACGLNDQIYLEILQGAKNIEAFEKLKRYFSGQVFYGFSNPRHAHERAAQLYLECRKNGVTLRSSLDTLIALCAEENRVMLLHNDRDYLQLGRFLPGLEQKHFFK